MTSYGATLAAARRELTKAGIESAGLDARMLLAAAAGIDTAELIARSGEELPVLAQTTLAAHLRRRIGGEPVARILGAKEFWGLSFVVTEATLVPRPETEILVETVLAEARSGCRGDLRICDLGTGCGAIVIALLTELLDATGAAVDISEAALRAARVNAERLGVVERMSFHQADFSGGPDGPFDVVVSNPPYIASELIASLPREVRDHDPRLALDGGPDGLSAYRAILRRAPLLLKEGGVLALEVGHDQAAAVAALCRRAGFESLAVRHDLAGIGRVVTAALPSPARALGGAKKALGKVGITG